MFDEINSRILQYLKPFSYVVEQKSITRAAELLFQSPSAVSQQISKLEEELGTQLFERKKGQKLTLLPSGKRLYDSLPSLDNALFRMRSDLKTFNTTARAPLRLGVLPLLRERLMNIIESYNARHDLLFALTENNDGTELCNSILAGDLDCALLFEEYIHEKLKILPLYTSPLILVCHRALVEQFGPCPSKEQLYSLPLIYITVVYHKILNLDAYAELPLTGPRQLQVDNPLAALEAVRHKLGAAIICKEALLRETDPEILTFHLENDRYFRKISLAMPYEMPVNEHALFIKYLRDSC